MIKNTLSKTTLNLVFIVCFFLFFGVLYFAYSNHFNNIFIFDDDHTILNNTAIQEIDIVKFFTDPTTISSLPANQTYRPYLALENAIDYQLAGGLNSKAFHIHIFITFVLLCIAILFFVKLLLEKLGYLTNTKFYGLLAASMFGLLCANAETVNYIIQRAEIVAAFYIVLGFVFYLKGGIWKKYNLYLFFPFIGFFVKEMGFVFSPLLFLYVLVFEEKAYLGNFFKKSELLKIKNAFITVLPSVLFTALFLVFYSQMLPKTFTPGGVDRWSYLITQPYVVCHYFITFFYPYNLSLDSDQMVFTSIMEDKAILGFLGLFLLLYVAIKLTKSKQTRLISFGILWFLIALLPTSSVIPFSEVLNDHRAFTPYIGLVIAVIFTVKRFFDILIEIFKNVKVHYLAYLLLGIFFTVNVYGIRQRNEVWSSPLLMWKDVTEKSPKNGRGLMNYGLALMAKGDYQQAETYYKKALVYNPNYTNLYINLGILKDKTGFSDEAEAYFKRAIACNFQNFMAYYYYANFLNLKNRQDEAIVFLKKSLDDNLFYYNSQVLLLNLYHQRDNWLGIEQIVGAVLNVAPDNKLALEYAKIAKDRISYFTLQENRATELKSADLFLSLSLHYFNQGEFEKCIKMAEKAIEIKPNFAEAYNNIGIAYYNLKNTEKAIENYKAALKLNPEFTLAKNNLLYASNTTSVSNSKTAEADNYLNLSLKHFNEGNYRACIDAAIKSNQLRPSANAYNNICCAYNQLQEYDKAVIACEKALKIQSEHVLAKGNLAHAKNQISLR
ncbi:tetratricopeptide repeat protein [Flavobacterium lacisediminis]|uniref:Tetratricopeptide repeat protein n=1 Tax=Flavobacterium lacisediminis TaxID=2989705 RepID=A0ABT3EJR9_9FLAO|nr:tetratricopeptide repeat protein [Flavobacterium lacisediminis]MCW1148823.1 tetratricopeptide repeat protein [Flavobacterium lacisediminis]